MTIQNLPTASAITTSSDNGRLQQQLTLVPIDTEATSNSRYNNNNRDVVMQQIMQHQIMFI